MSGTRRGLVAPQNTFLEKIIRRCNGQFQSFLLANARIVDYPIVYCNEGFAKMTGYNRVDIMQKSSSCAYLYGEQTTEDMKTRLMQALNNQAKEQLEILLYKKNPGLNKFARLARSVTRNRTMLQTATPAPLSATTTSITSPQWSLLSPPESAPAGGSVDGRSFSPSPHRSPSPQATNSASTGIDDDLARGDLLSPTPKTPNDLEKGATAFASWMDVVPPYKQEAPKTPPHVILHYVAFKTAWDWMILFLTGYTAVMVPFNAAFRSKTIDDVIFLVIDSIVDVIFFIDIVLNFHTTFVGPQGEVISDATVIRINYLKGWFIVDLLSCLPYDVFNAFQPEATQSTISSLFSALKVVRLLRIGRVTRKLDQYLEYMAASLFLMIFGFVLLAHWLACIWYSIGMSDLENLISYGWIPRLSSDIGLASKNFSLFDAKNVSVSRSMTYITALYYTLSLITSIGFGNVSANTFGEKIVSVIFMLIGAFSYATIFGQVTTIFQGMYAARSRYHDMMGSVKDFIKTHNVPQDLAERVIDYVTSTWAITKGIDTAKVLNYCPKDMKADLCIHLNRMVFNEHPAFRLASDGCLRSLAVNFNTLHTAPGDLIFHQGESIDQLCFVVTGSLEVIQDDEIVAILGRGDVFGEPFWKDPTRMSHSSATVRALTYCDLHYIKKDRLLHVLDFYTAFANSFARNLVLSYDLKTRLIFRKLEDVRRERELAEHRNNEGHLSELTADHPVRRMIHRFRKIGTANVNALTASSTTANETSEGGDDRVTPTSSLSSILVAPQRRKSMGGIKPPTVEETPAAPSKPASRWGRLLAGGAGGGGGSGGDGGGADGSGEVASGGGGLTGEGSGSTEKTTTASSAKFDTTGGTLTQVDPPAATKRVVLSSTGLTAKRSLQSQAIAEEDESQATSQGKPKLSESTTDKKVQLVLDAISSMQSSVMNEITAVNRRIDMIDDHLLKLYEIVGQLKETHTSKGRQPYESDEGESVSSILRLFRKSSPPSAQKTHPRKSNPDYVRMQHFVSGHSRKNVVPQVVSRKIKSVKTSRVSPLHFDTELNEIHSGGQLVFQDFCGEADAATYRRPPPRIDYSTRRTPTSGGRLRSRSPVAMTKYDTHLGSGDGLSSLSTLGGDDLEHDVAFHARGVAAPSSRRSNGNKSSSRRESVGRNKEHPSTLVVFQKKDTEIRGSAIKGSSPEHGKVSLL